MWLGEEEAEALLHVHFHAVQWVLPTLLWLLVRVWVPSKECLRLLV